MYIFSESWKSLFQLVNMTIVSSCLTHSNFCFDCLVWVIASSYHHLSCQWFKLYFLSSGTSYFDSYLFIISMRISLVVLEKTLYIVGPFSVRPFAILYISSSVLPK